MIPFVSAQLLAHVLADFCFQTEQMCCGKREKSFCSGALYLHVGLVFFFSWLMAFTWNFAFYALIIAATHWLIDGLKARINRKWPERGGLVFGIDQVLHLLMVWGISAVYLSRNPANWPGVEAGKIVIVLLG